STARKTSGSSCVRIGCQTGFSNPSTISSTTAATLGTHSLTNPGRLCPSRDETGQQSVTQSEDWYQTAEVTGATISAPDVHRIDWGVRSLITTSLFLIAGGFGWFGATASHWPSDPQRLELSGAAGYSRGRRTNHSR